MDRNVLESKLQPQTRAEVVRILKKARNGISRKRSHCQIDIHMERVTSGCREPNFRRLHSSAEESTHDGAEYAKSRNVSIYKHLPIKGFRTSQTRACKRRETLRQQLRARLILRRRHGVTVHPMTTVQTQITFQLFSYNCLLFVTTFLKSLKLTNSRSTIQSDKYPRHIFHK